MNIHLTSIFVDHQRTALELYTNVHGRSTVDDRWSPWAGRVFLVDLSRRASLVVPVRFS